MKWTLERNQIVQYRHGSGGQHWQGIIIAREFYDCNGVPEEVYWVRWIDPSGRPSEKSERFPVEELEAKP